MKKFLMGCLCLLAAFPAAKGQPADRFSYSTTLGTGIWLSTPASTPVNWQIAGYYNIGRRFSAGVGTGLSFYEKTLLPVFGEARFLLTQPRRFTPVLSCASGYAFAPGQDAKGGFLLHPAMGLEYATRQRLKLWLSVGYESQRMERLKEYQCDYFATGFHEKLHHNSLSVRIGIVW